MVTEIVETDGDNIPAPSITIITVEQETDVQYFKREAESCLNQSTSLAMDCIQNIGNKVEDLFQVSDGWTRYFNIYGGWQYFRKGNLSMKDLDKVLPITIGVKNSKLQVFIHDANEILNFYSDIEILEFSIESTSVFLKVHKIQRVNNCNTLPSYTFVRCVEKYIEKAGLNKFGV